MAKLTDESLMPFGKHKGEQMINVPASYLIWLHENGKTNADVAEYIKENMSVLQHELNKQKP